MTSVIDKPFMVVKRQYIASINGNETKQVLYTDNLADYGYRVASALVASDNAGIEIHTVTFSDTGAYLHNITSETGSGVLTIIWALS